MRVPLLASLAVTLFCLGCAGSDFDTTPQIIYTDISGVYGAQVGQRNFGHLALTLELVEDTRTVYTAEMANLRNDDLEVFEGIGTLADDHLILNFDRGKSTDFYFEGAVTDLSEGLYEISGQFVFPDVRNNVAALFREP